MMIYSPLFIGVFALYFSLAGDGTLTAGERLHSMPTHMKHVTADTTIAELLVHPAFNGFSQLLLTHERDVDWSGRLQDVSSLLPYHSMIDTNTVLAAINHMIDDAGNGQRIFYDFYSRQQKQEDVGKTSTGMFFFRGKPGAPFAVICPGGGFSYVGSFHEGFPYAMELAKKGYNAFVLRYRVGEGGMAAMIDLATALSFIFAHAEELGVRTKGYSLWGSSAGARMAAQVGSAGAARFGGARLPQPSAVIMAYTGHSEYARTDPPTFAVVGDNDGIAPATIMERRINNMRASGIDAEIRRYKNLGHGFGLGVNTSAEGWVSEAILFWERHIRVER